MKHYIKKDVDELIRLAEEVLHNPQNIDSLQLLEDWIVNQFDEE